MKNNNAHLYELLILGSGPAGLAAGIYAARAQLDFLVIEQAPMSGGQIINTYEVDNYPGIPGIGGFELASKFREHCEKLGVTFISGEVIEFKSIDEKKSVVMQNGEVYSARAIIIATGAVNKKLGIESEIKFSGKGISYCATCDGAFYRNKITAVIGGGDVAVEDAIFLARICKHVYVVHRRDEFRAAKILSQRLQELNNVTILWNTIIDEITGDEFVQGITTKNILTQEMNSYKLDGVFIAVGTSPNSEIFKDIVAADEKGYLKAGENGETNIPGIFAAGDVRTKELRQVITAAADGANAITAAERYLYQL